MKRFVILLAAVTALSAPAMAQNEPSHPSTPDQPQQPCTRNPGSKITIGGVDLAEVRCALLIDDARIADLDKELRSVSTSLAMTRNDLAATNKADEQRAKDLNEWFKGWFGSEVKAE